MFKYWFRIKTSLQESLGAKKPVLKLDLGKASYKDLVFARGEFLSVIGAQNESLRIILMYYMYKYWLGSHNNLARLTSEPKYPF